MEGKSGLSARAAWLRLLSTPVLLVGLGVLGVLLPFFTTVGYSFQHDHSSLPGHAGLQNYIGLLGDPAFWRTVRFSLAYTGATVGVQLALGLGIALLLRARNRINDLMAALLILPLAVPPAIAGQMWRLMTHPGAGMLNPVTGLGWTPGAGPTLFAVVLVDTWVYTPFVVMLVLAGLRALPTLPFEAAQLDGLPRAVVFLRITLPMLGPYIFVAGLFRMLGSLQQFDIIHAMAQGTTGHALTTFQVQAYLEACGHQNIGRAAALALILWLVTCALSAAVLRLPWRPRGP